MITDLYSTVLFVAVNVSFAVYHSLNSIWICKSIPNLEPLAPQAPSAQTCYSSTMGSETSSGGIIFVTKLAKACAFIALLETYLMSSTDNMTAHVDSSLESSGLWSTFQRGKFVLISIVWDLEKGHSFVTDIITMKASFCRGGSSTLPLSGSSWRKRLGSRL